MKFFRSVFLSLAVAGLTATSLMAQQPPARVSPHEAVDSQIDGGRVMVVYGRPYTKDPKSGEMRKIWGGLVPYGKVWRTGSNMSTLFVTEKAITVGGKSLPAGAYALFTLPKEDGSAMLILNKGVGQWGAYTYDEKQDVLRVEMKKTVLDAPVDQFTMGFDRNKAGGGALKMAWEKTQYSVDLAGQK